MNLNEVKEDLVWITLINYGYIHYTKNFLKSMELNNINFKLYIFCLDDRALNAFDEFENCECIKVNFLNFTPLERMTGWGDMEYRKIVYAKLDAILYALKNFKNVKNIGYIDTDIFLFSNPTDIFSKYLHEYQDIDIFCQCDERGRNCINVNGCYQICTGVIVIRNKEYLYDLFKYKEDDLKKYVSDQAYFIIRLKKNKIKYMTLPKNILPNGSYYPNIKTQKINFEKENCLLHFNYLIGNKKEDVMKFQGCWII
jgi:hypothetical protein